MCLKKKTHKKQQQTQALLRDTWKDLKIVTNFEFLYRSTFCLTFRHQEKTWLHKALEMANTSKIKWKQNNWIKLASQFRVWKDTKKFRGNLWHLHLPVLIPGDVIARDNSWKWYSTFHPVWENEIYLCPPFPCHSQFQLFLTWKPFYTFDHLCCPSLDLCQGLPFCRAFMNQLSTDLGTDTSRTSLVTSLHSHQGFVFYFSITDIAMLGSPLLYHSCFAFFKAFGKGCIKILSKTIQTTSTKPCYPCACWSLQRITDQKVYRSLERSHMDSSSADLTCPSIYSCYPLLESPLISWCCESVTAPSP